jgi:hypothetical protein
MRIDRDQFRGAENRDGAARVGRIEQEKMHHLEV